MKVPYSVVCIECEKTYTFPVDPDDVYRWSKLGVFVQDAFPYLSSDERELLISRTCGRCFDKIFEDDFLKNFPR